jgi:poly(glycerol-phosphate) alpha-glucosyltransferase
MSAGQPLQGLRIGLLTTSASRNGGGVFEAVVRQAAMIRALGGEALVFALRDAFSDADASRFAPGAVRHFPIVGPRQIGYAPDLMQALLGAELDLLHLHGIWMYPSRAATRWRQRTGRPYLISVHGMLDPTTVNRRPWKKALGRLLYEKASWRVADAFHALTVTEARNIRTHVPVGEPIVIPNAAPPALAAARSGPQGARYLFLGRIHPQKNLGGLIKAWGAAALGGDAELVIAGWGDSGDVAALEADIAAAGPSLRFLGPVHGEAKQDLLASARFTILPSLGEAMPMTVLEGWAAGVPAIVSHQSNLPEGLAAGAALACGTDPESIAAALRQAHALDDAGWRAMAEAGLDLVRGPFSAEVVAAQWAAVYRGAVTTKGNPGR